MDGYKSSQIDFYSMFRFFLGGVEGRCLNYHGNLKCGTHETHTFWWAASNGSRLKMKLTAIILPAKETRLISPDSNSIVSLLSYYIPHRSSLPNAIIIDRNRFLLLFHIGRLQEVAMVRKTTDRSCYVTGCCCPQFIFIPPTEKHIRLPIIYTQSTFNYDNRHSLE